jgi:hypothetical protein
MYHGSWIMAGARRESSNRKMGLRASGCSVCRTVGRRRRWPYVIRYTWWEDSRRGRSLGWRLSRSGRFAPSTPSGPCCHSCVQLLMSAHMFICLSDNHRRVGNQFYRYSFRTASLLFFLLVQGARLKEARYSLGHRYPAMGFHMLLRRDSAVPEPSRRLFAAGLL